MMTPSVGRCFTVLSAFAVTLASVSACGTANGGGFLEPEPTLVGGPDGVDGGFGSSGGVDANTPDAFRGCASATITGSISPVHLVIAFDESSSMCQDVSATTEEASGNCAQTTSKWQQSRAALSAFFAAPASRGVNVSIIPWANTFLCGVSSTPIAPADHPLPDTAGALDKALAAILPFGGTPTKQAIDAAKAYAESLKAMVPTGEQIVIALVTDGLPSSQCCTLAESGAAAKAAGMAGFPVYVIGVGQQLTNLNQIALAANTNGGKAVLVQGNVSVEFNNALNEIKKKSLGCGVRLPKAPAGQTVDYKKVNLTHTDNKGVEKTLQQSQDCKDPEGWKYVPNETAPTSIEFCSGICAEVKANEKGSIGVVLGCETKVSIPK